MTIPEELNFEFRRKRFLEDSNATISSSNKTTPEEIHKLSQQQISNIYNGYRAASDKANVLMTYASKVASKYTIPVPKESLEIRQAVLRQDKDTGDGSYISFDLFQRMIDTVESMAAKTDYDVIDTKVSVDPIGNERIIRKKIDSEFGDENGAEALLLVTSQIGVLYLMHLITGIWRGPEVAVAAPKQGSGVGAVVIEQVSPITEGIRQAAIGFSAAQIVLGVNNALLSLFNNEGNARHTNSQVVQGAIGQAKQTVLPPLVQKISKAMGANDHKLIIEYCMSYIANTNEKGYEFWYAYIVARKTRFMSALSLKSSPLFSENDFNKLNGIPDSAIVDPSNIVINQTDYLRFLGGNSTLENVAGDIQSLLNRSIVTPTEDFLCAKDYEASSFEKGLNVIAQILDTKLSRDVLCCLARFLGHIDLSILQKIRAILSIYINIQVLDLGATLQNFAYLFSSWIRETIVRIIMELVQVILDKIYRIVADFLHDISADIEILQECPLILELISGILDALDRILIDINEIIKNHIETISLNISVSFGLTDLNAHSGLIKIHKKRSLRRLLMIIDSIISTIESGYTICDDEDSITNNVEKSKLITYDQLIDKNRSTYEEEYLDIPDQLKSQYFSNAYEVQFKDGTILPSYDIGELRISDGKSTNECYPALPNETLEKIIGKYRDSK